jgi:SAM-dependent methyltransferase
MRHAWLLAPTSRARYALTPPVTELLIDPRYVMNNYKTAFYPESRFGGFTDIDGTIAFYSRVNALAKASFVVLDFGCGRGAKHHDDPITFKRELQLLKGKVTRVIGLDIDEVGQTNEGLDEFRLLTPGRSWPIDDRAVNMIICDFVIEHLPDPAAFFNEAKRVLVEGGYLCIRTPNVCSYVGVISRLVPNRLHAGVLSKVQTNRKKHDVFPTFYRCNTVWALRRLLRDTQFSGVVYGYEAEPSYLSFAAVAYAVGVAHQKFAPNFLKPAIFAFARLVIRET